MSPFSPSPHPDGPDGKERAAPPPLAVGWLSLACGGAVATLYYNQPLLPLIGQSFGRGGADLGWIAMTTQIGYAAGLVLFGPLGDTLAPALLIRRLLAVNVAGLLLAAAAPGFAVLLAASALLGLTAITAQVIIPAVSGLVDPARRGATVGRLVSGLVAGQVLARTVSGLIGGHGGWRTMFVVAALFDLALLVLLHRALPAFPTKRARVPYGALIRSLGSLIRREPLLREVSAAGFLLFASVSALWGSLAFLLARPPFGWGADIAGLFGLVGLLGMLSAPVIGAMVDRRGGRFVATAGALLVIAAFALVALAPRSTAALVAAVALLDLGGRAGLVANQSRLYALRGEARSRLNAVFLGFYFAGGAIGSALGTGAAARAGWTGLALVGALSAVASLAVMTGAAMIPPRAARHRQGPG